MRVTANGVGLEYRLEGPARGSVVTLAHPLGATAAIWDAQVAALAGRYRVLRYDARGHGRSDVPPPPYSLDQMADDLFALLDTLGIERTHFCGLSMGGCVAMQAALRAPARFQSLVLCDTTTRYAPHTAPMWADRIRTAQTVGMGPMVEPTMDIWFSPAFRDRGKAVVDQVRGMLRATDPRGYVGAIRAIADVDLTDAVAAIRCPALVVVGEDDPGTTPEMARAIHERIAGSELVILPGARHCSPVEAADAFNAAMLAFLRTLE